MNNEKKFFHLNLENHWPSFKLHGLAINQRGSLTLAQVPEVATSTEVTLKPPASLNIPVAGIATDTVGNIYFSYPGEDCIFKYDPCTEKIEPIPCLTGLNGVTELFDTPRGLLVRPNNTLCVADSGNHRLLIFDLFALQLKEVWGQAEPFINPQASAKPGRLDDPREIAGDSAGYVYVVDHGNRRIQKFDDRGNVIQEFWQTVSAQVTLQEPSFITIAKLNKKEELIFVVDCSPINEDDQVFVFDTDGHLKTDWNFSVKVPFESEKVNSSGIVVFNNAVYIGDNNRNRNGVLKFKITGKFAGRARGYNGPVAALGLDRAGNILVHPGDPQKMVRLIPDKAFVPTGSFLAGPYKPKDIAVQWHRLKVDAEPLSKNAHLQLFAYTTNKLENPVYKPESENPFADKTWYEIPQDVVDALIPSLPGNDVHPLSRQYAESNAPLPRVSAKYLWLGGLFQGDENVSPTVHQIRIDYNQDTYLGHLPPIYAKDAKSREFMQRFLSLFESVMKDIEARITGLPALFDPYATAKGFLPWLTSWLALDPDEDWDEGQIRDAIVRAFKLQSKRGTVDGLQQYLKLYANVDAVIEEPLLSVSLWCLPAKQKTITQAEQQQEDWLICPPVSEQDETQNNQTKIKDGWQYTESSLLGYTTMLVPAHAQGAVVGATATLDQSHLIAEKDYGSPLFEDLAYFFYVLVYWNQLKCQNDLDKVKTVIEREKPAHTDYHLCVIEPKMRLGFQSRVGIDTIVADEPPDMVLTKSSKLGQDTVISNISGIRRKEGIVGGDTRVGYKTKIT